MLRVEMHELQKVFERQVGKLAGGVLGQPQCSTLDRAAEADMGVTRAWASFGISPCWL